MAARPVAVLAPVLFVRNVLIAPRVICLTARFYVLFVKEYRNLIYSIAYICKNAWLGPIETPQVRKVLYGSNHALSTVWQSAQAVSGWHLLKALSRVHKIICAVRLFIVLYFKFIQRIYRPLVSVTYQIYVILFLYILVTALGVPVSPLQSSHSFVTLF